MAKRPGRETDNSLSPIAHVRNVWGYIGVSTPPYAFMLWKITNVLDGFVQHVISRRQVTLKVFIALQLKSQVACYKAVGG
jgi:hypothetical protein